MSQLRGTITAQARQRVTPSNREKEHGARYMYPFSLELEPRPDVTAYKLRLSDRRNQSLELTAPGPVIDLAPVWDRLAVGHVRLNAIAVGTDGDETNYGHAYTFFKATAFESTRPDGLRERIDHALDTSFGFLVNTQAPGNFDPETPLFIWHSVLRSESRFVYQNAYPGLHYGNYIDFFRGYARVRPEKEAPALAMAQLTGDRAAEFLTPPSFEWPSYPYSTVSRGKLGGDQEVGDTIQPVKAAMVGSAMFDHAVATGNARWLEFVLHIGRTLAAKQATDGSLPFRVDARTGREEPGAGRTTSLIFAVNLWERLDRRGPESFRRNRDAALRWLFDGPVQDFRWVADYEDVPTAASGQDSDNFNNLDAMATAHYLLRHRHEDEENLALAMALERWIEEGFVFYAPEYPVDFIQFPCPAVMEQAWHYYPINGHLAGYSKLQLALYEATGNRLYLEKAESCADALLKYITEDGEMLTYAPDPAVGYGYDDSIWLGCVARVCLALLRLREVLGGSIVRDGR